MPAANNEQNNQHRSDAVGSSRTIQPLHADEVKAAVAKTVANSVVPVGMTENTQQKSNQSRQQTAYDDWKPHTSLAHRIPALRYYAIVLVGASAVLAYLSQSEWIFSEPSTKTLNLAMYGTLGLMFVTGIIFLFSRSKRLVLFLLNTLLTLTVVGAIISGIDLNSITLVFSLVIAGILLKIRYYVRQAI